jgi:hypothetical protein
MDEHLITGQNLCPKNYTCYLGVKLGQLPPKVIRLTKTGPFFPKCPNQPDF